MESIIQLAKGLINLVVKSLYPEISLMKVITEKKIDSNIIRNEGKNE